MAKFIVIDKQARVFRIPVEADNESDAIDIAMDLMEINKEQYFDDCEDETTVEDA